MFRSYKPSAPLDRFIQRIWCYEDGCLTSPVERIFPDGMVKWMINLGDHPVGVRKQKAHGRVDWLSTSVLCGPQLHSYGLATPNPFRLAGVWFRPGGAAPFLRISAHELLGQHVPARLALKSDAEAARDELLHSPTLVGKLTALERRLRGVLRTSTEDPGRSVVAPAIRVLQQSQSIPRIGEIREQSELSHRRFVHEFRDHVGVSPKLFSRMQRFQAALCAVDRGSHIDWADLAISTGHYDQPHFIREFRSFAGCTPTQYLSARRQHKVRIPEAMGQFFTIADGASSDTIGA